MTVIGALIPSVIKATVPFVYKKNGVELVIQDTLDAILPSLVPSYLFFDLLDVRSKETKFHTSDLDYFNFIDCFECLWYFGVKVY